METEESALCALHNRVHQVDKVLIAKAFYLFFLLDSCIAVQHCLTNKALLFLFFLLILIFHTLTAPSVELMSERLHRVAVRGSIWRNT